MAAKNSKPIKKFSVGQLVTSNFDNEYMMMYSRASLDATIANDTRFYRDEIGVVISVVDAPDSFYTAGYAMILIRHGKGWVPFRWLKFIS